MADTMHLIPLDETDLYVLFKDYEEVFLFEKDTNSDLWRISMYGEATCGVIGLSGEWAVAGGKDLILWKDDGTLKFVNDPDLEWIFDMKHSGETEVTILTDPWGENPAVWKFDIVTEKKTKTRDFPDYKDQEYTDDVKW